MANDVIIALDFENQQKTLAFLDRFPAGEKPYVKIGMELFYAEGPEIVRQIKDDGKIAIVHADLITGLAAKEISVDFLHSTTLADGIISTRTNMIQRAKELQMIAILRVFLIDSMAFDAALGARNLKPDAIDILPGLMPSMIRKVRQMTGIPVLTGGLITEKREVMQALEAGALAISSTAPDVWRM